MITSWEHTKFAFSGFCVISIFITRKLSGFEHSQIAGYVGTVTDVSTIGYSDPGMTNSNMQVLRPTHHVTCCKALNTAFSISKPVRTHKIGGSRSIAYKIGIIPQTFPWLLPPASNLRHLLQSHCLIRVPARRQNDVRNNFACCPTGCDSTGGCRCTRKSKYQARARGMSLNGAAISRLAVLTLSAVWQKH